MKCLWHVLTSVMILLPVLRAATQAAKPSTAIPSVAVIGGGIGGATSSLYLSRLFGEGKVQIDVYEKNLIGGRTSVVEVGNSFYEAGASIIHSKNRYLIDIAHEFGLEHRTSSDGGKLGIYDGKKFVFRESEYYWLNIAKLLWRYGRSILYCENLINDLLNKFDRIYELQNDGHAFTTVENLLTSMDPSFVNLTRISAANFLEELGFGRLFIDELVTAVTRVNYGQTTCVNAFVGSVSLAAAQGGLWSVKGGNYLLAEVALKASKAVVIKATAQTITLKDGRYLLSTKCVDDNNNEDTQEKMYDIVIVAAPQTEDLASVKFVGFPHIHNTFPGHYHRTVTTFVQGKVNSSYFGLQNDEDIGDIININTKLNYNSVSENCPVTSVQKSTKSKVFKVFSQEPLSDQELKSIFNDIEETKVVDWLAYPQYVPPEKLGLFQLHDRLYYTSSIEWIASAMEMSAIAGRNTALLAYNQWLELNSKVDSAAVMKRPNADKEHGEL